MSAVAREAQRCLLILPRGFYSLTGVIESGLKNLGYETVIANDEYPESFFGKVISKLGLPLSHAITRRVLLNQFLTGQRYDLIIVIKGRGLDARTAASLSLHGRTVVGYHFDSFRFDRGPARWRDSIPRVSTFDYRDAEEHGLPVVELFASMPPATPTRQRRYRVSAILRNHSQRLAYLDRVMTALGDSDAFIYIFEANWLTFTTNFLRHPLLYLKYRRFISRKPLPYNQYVAAIADSEFTIDYAHPKQTGITIRCFEALSAGTRIITNNPWVMKCTHFSDDNAIVFGRGIDTGTLRQQMRALPGHPPPAYRRTVEDFLVDLIGPTPPSEGLAPSLDHPQPSPCLRAE